MQLFDILDLKKTIFKTSSSLPIFIFGYALILNQSILNWIFLIVSIISCVIFFILEDDKIVRGIVRIILEDKEKKKIAYEISKTKAKPFILKGIILFFTFLWRVFAMIMIIIFMIKSPDAVIGILLIISITGILYSIGLVLAKKEQITSTTKLLKGRN